MAEPIIIVPWTGDFIDAVENFLLRDAEGPDGLGRRHVVFPHQRPAAYLRERIRGDDRIPKPCRLPAMSTSQDFVASLRGPFLDAPLTRAGLLDQVGLLYEVVFGLRDKGELATHLPDDRQAFFPWGVRLAGLFEELFRQNLEPDNLLYLDYEVLPWAAALLGRLREICAAYLAGLAEQGWTTVGLDARWAARNLDQAAEAAGSRSIVLAGLYGLSGVEDAVFRRLWEDGKAAVLWHTDPALADGRPGHYAVEEHKNWLGRWKARAEVMEMPDGGQDVRPTFAFYEGYDLHSQLGAMRGIMDQEQDLDQAAVVIPEPAMLMPVLHSLPRHDVNISMGFPATRTSLYRLVEAVVRLQETSERGLYYWRDLITLIRHPYLKMLRTDSGAPMRGPLHALEESLRRGSKLADPFSWQLPDEAVPEGASREECEALLSRILAACLTAFAGTETLADLASALAGLARLLSERGGDMWRRFPLDAECLYRLLQVIIPTLEGSTISREPFARPILHTVLRQYFESERVAFEAEPLGGLQVMGFLEARLLHFRTLFILNATEDMLPGTAVHDPLLPDPLRHLLGLPDGRSRDIVAAYNFYRLVSSAGHVHVFYSSGSSGTGLFEEKSVRSRFVEQLLFEHELRAGVPLKKGEPPVRLVPFRLFPPTQAAPAVARTEAITGRLLRYLEAKPLSPSFFDSFLKCPFRFYHERLTPLRPVDEVREDGDAAGLGTVVHKALQDFYEPFLGKDLDPSALSLEKLAKLYIDGLRGSDFYAHLEYDLRLLLERTGLERLGRHLASAAPTRIVAQERRVSVKCTLEGRACTLEGIIDRVDEREDGLVILDYKTGTPPKPDRGVWEDEELWDRVRGWRDDGDESPLAEVADRVRSVQLPLYLYLYRQAGFGEAGRAAWIDLAENGGEVPLFPDKLAPEAREETILRRTPALVSFLLRHMLRSEAFLPRPSRGCAYCSFAGLCGQDGER